MRELRRDIETHLPRIRVEDLLVEVDSWCHFTDALAPLGGYRPRVEDLYPKLLAALVAHGTNLGITTMGHSTEGMTVDQLDHVSQRYLRPDTLKAANRMLVDFHHRLPLFVRVGPGDLLVLRRAAVRHAGELAPGVVLPPVLRVLRPRDHGVHARVRPVATPPVFALYARSSD